MQDKINLEELSRSALEELITDAQRVIVKRVKEELAVARAAAEKLARDHGFTLEELVNQKSGSRSRKPTEAPKYANPDDPSVTWSGRGRQPNWFKAALSTGKTRESMLL